MMSSFMLLFAFALVARVNSLPSHAVLPGSSLVTRGNYENPYSNLDNQYDPVIRTSLNSAYVMENLCGIKLNFDSQPDTNLKNFCKDSFKSRKDESNLFLKADPSDHVRVCYSYLCGWYQEQCHQGGRNGSRGLPFEFGPCGCIHNLWVECRCDIVLKNTNWDNEQSQTDTGKAHIDIRFGQKDERKKTRYNIPVQRRAADDGRMASDDPDSFVFVDDADQAQTEIKSEDPFSVDNYNEEQRKCFTLKQIWYNGQCVKLKSEEACGPGEWLVLQKPANEGDLSELDPVCSVKKCTAKNEVWWPSESRCINKTTAAKIHCNGKDVLVEHDSFGDGYCTCYDDSGSFEGSTDCYEFYQKGPCDITQVVTYDKATGNAVCSKDLCYKLNHPRNRVRARRESENLNKQRREAKSNEEEKYFTESSNDGIQKFSNPYVPNLDEFYGKIDRFKRQSTQKKFYAPFGGDGQCYKIGPQQICDSLGKNAQFKFHKVLKVPECFVSISNALHLIDSRPGCKVDESNNCRQEVKLAQTSEQDFLLHLKNQARKKRDTPKRQ